MNLAGHGLSKSIRSGVSFRVAVVELCPMAPRDALEGQAKQARPLQPREVLLLCFICQVLNKVCFEKEVSLL